MVDIVPRCRAESRELDEIAVAYGGVDGMLHVV